MGVLRAQVRIALYPGVRIAVGTEGIEVSIIGAGESAAVAVVDTIVVADLMLQENTWKQIKVIAFIYLAGCIRYAS